MYNGVKTIKYQTRTSGGTKQVSPFIMLDILNQLLQKRGVTYDELREDEKVQFGQWKLVLTKDELTTQDIKNFCQQQVDIIEAKWSDLNLEQTKKAEMIPYHTVYNLLLKVIDSPKEAKEALEKNLRQLI